MASPRAITTASPPPTAATAASDLLLNRVVFVLSLLGVLVAGFLWAAHATHADIPCGGSGGCDKVAASPYSRFPAGGTIPVAALGTMGYLLLAGLAVARTVRPQATRPLLGLIVLIALVATAFSLYLTYVELFIIDAVCRWCLASQTIIVGILAVALADQVRRRGERFLV